MQEKVIVFVVVVVVIVALSLYKTQLAAQSWHIFNLVSSHAFQTHEN